MKPKIFIPLIGLVLLTLWARRPPAKPAGLTERGEGGRPVAVSPPAARKNAAPERRAHEVVRPRAHFTSKEEIKQLEKVVVDVSDTIDPDKRLEAFKQSGLDTPEHLESAIAIVKAPYTEPHDDEAVYLRLLALHYLALTSRLEIAPCTALLDQTIKRYESGTDVVASKPYLWDAHDIAQVCTRIDSRTMVEYQRAQTNTKIGAQLKLVLKTEGVL